MSIFLSNFQIAQRLHVVRDVLANTPARRSSEQGPALFVVDRFARSNQTAPSLS